MPALVRTSHSARIVWLGVVPHRDEQVIATTALETMPLGYDGYQPDFHAGLTRPSCSRVLSQYPRNTDIRNVRQLSIVCASELAAVATAIGLDALDPALVGASIVLDGIPDFSHIPPSSRLQSQNGVTLTVDMQNRPCHLPALTIAQTNPEAGKRFKAAAKGRRGITAWVERPGTLAIGDTLTLHIPDQRGWLAQADLFNS